MKLTLLGTGTPAPSLTRQSSGYLVEVGGDLIVMDQGPGTQHRLMEAGHRAVDVGYAFFSHMHYDHCLDYPRLVLQRWDMGADRIPDLAVFGPPPIARMTEQLFGLGGVWDADIQARLAHPSSLDVFVARGGALPRRRPRPVVREVKAGDVVEGRHWKVRVGHAQHVQPQLDCLAFRIDSDEGSLVYSGDCGGVCEELIELAQGCDVLVHMNHFFSGTEPSEAYRRACGNHRDNALVARRAGVKTLVLTHVLSQIDQPGLRERIVREIAQEFDGDVVWGEDLMTIGVGRGAAPASSIGD
jgi:ribonuclease Z